MSATGCARVRGSFHTRWPVWTLPPNAQGCQWIQRTGPIRAPGPDPGLRTCELCCCTREIEHPVAECGGRRCEIGALADPSMAGALRIPGSFALRTGAMAKAAAASVSGRQITRWQQSSQTLAECWEEFYREQLGVALYLVRAGPRSRATNWPAPRGK